MTLKWERTSIDGRTALEDDWSLADGGLSLARLYRLSGGPQAGRWAWFVQVWPDGTPGNGGTGVEATGKAAREACEALLPGRFRERLRGDGAGRWG